MTLTVPSTRPRSFTMSTPLFSNSGFRRSSTEGLHMFALSINNQWPFSRALINKPSIHSNLPATVSFSSF
ncbi:hypothetical protein BD560DRAFT_394108 [Blakeslea trispora]|nr:hypothetical protein BD560DRAFT_394108 [Blakeslea trispora]